MIRTQISLDEKVYQRAQAAARKQGISLAEFVRRALGKVLEPEKVVKVTDRPWSRWTGSIRGGGSHASDPDEIDRVVYGRDP
ncbi:MAG TPA: ribbon-helix-helix protein, CopG family [Kofleriaceae bacterium]|jgi:hypothetical protein|nr:ribbon-helix-helix protein, CopG family [Kofleriaceae bacterium]